MRYAHLIYLDESKTELRSPAEVKAAIARHAPYIDMLRRSGRYHGSEVLATTAFARTLRRINDNPLVTQGPFAETREQLGGLYLVEADDLDGAVALVRENPAFATVATAFEVRPIVQHVDGTASGEPRFVLAHLGGFVPRASPALVTAAAFADTGVTVRRSGVEPAIGAITGISIVVAPDLDAAAALGEPPVEIRPVRT